jgi:hypothetical protein
LKIKKITIKDLKETIRPSKKTPLLEFIILGQGKNFHQIVDYSKDAKYVSESDKTKSYDVKDENLLVVKPFWRRKKLVAIFKNDTAPIRIEHSNDKITAEILQLANTSSTLGRTIKELFTTHLDMKKGLFFLIIGVVGVIIALVLGGVIKI